MRLSFAEGHPATIAEVTSSDPRFGIATTTLDDSRRAFDIEVTPPAEAINYTVITVRTLVGIDQAERSFNLVARTLPAPAPAAQAHP
jgi:hypothetical protein